MERVRQILWDQLEAAKRRKEFAAKEFDTITSETPSGLPHPDGTKRIENASAAFRHALHEYTEACKRMSDFVVNGIVPEDLLDRAQGRRKG